MIAAYLRLCKFYLIMFLCERGAIGTCSYDCILPLPILTVAIKISSGAVLLYDALSIGARSIGSNGNKVEGVTW